MKIPKSRVVSVEPFRWPETTCPPFLDGGTGASAFTPADVRSAAKIAWWLFSPQTAYSDAGVTLATPGQSVRQLTNLFGGGWDLAQATLAERPTLLAGTGLGGVFDGTMSLSCARPGGGSQPQPFVEYTVAKFTGATGGNMTVTDGQYQNEFRVYAADPNVGASMYAVGAVAGSFVMTVGTAYTIRKFSYTGKNGSGWSLNGGAARTATLPATITGFNMGGNTPDNQHLVGVIYETVVLNDPTAAEDAAVMAYLRRWGHY